MLDKRKIVTQPVAFRQNNQIYSEIKFLMEKQMSIDESKLPENWVLVENGISAATQHKILKEFARGKLYPTSINVAEERAAIETIKQSDPTDFKAISASKLTLSNSFYNNALRQSQQSFLWSLIWAGVGALFIISTVTLVIVLQPTIATSVIIALLGGTGGVGSSAIAYATLQLYKQASEQAAACHIRLDRTSDFILINSACEGLDGQEKKEMRSEIIRKLFE